MNTIKKIVVETIVINCGSMRPAFLHSFLVWLFLMRSTAFRVVLIATQKFNNNRFLTEPPLRLVSTVLLAFNQRRLIDGFLLI